jgi:hypothetical protein
VTTSASDALRRKLRERGPVTLSRREAEALLVELEEATCECCCQLCNTAARSLRPGT